MSKVYPNLDTLMRVDNQIYRSSGNLETNCGQIFTKGTAITKDIIEKIEDANLGPKTTVFFGRKFKTRQLWVLSGLVLLFLTSCMGTALMLFTTMYDNFILSNMILANNTPAYNMWKDPPVTVMLKVYIFNYTNVNDYEEGKADKLNVNEIGPFVYEESSKKVDITFHPNGTVSYRDVKSHKFRADLSTGRKQSEHLVVPNMPLLGAAAISKHSYYFTRFAMSTLLQSLNSNLFLNLPADRFIWGYDDTFYALAKGVLSFQKRLPFEKFGILASRNVTADDLITIYTGATAINKLKMIDNINGEKSMNQWSTDECNSIQGTDGSAFSPYTIRQKKPVSIYTPGSCRALPYIFQKEVKILNGKVPAYRYILADSVFDTPNEVPENQCYCDMNSGECPLKGVFNMTPCTFGAPAYMSLPHFYKGDSSFKDSITGLTPNKESAYNYIDVHPKLGISMAGKSRLQMNVQIKKSFGMTQLDVYEDDMILPIAWIEMSVDDEDFPNFVKEQIYTFSFTIPAIEMAIKYGCMLTAFVTLIAIIIVLRSKLADRILKLRNMERNTEL